MFGILSNFPNLLASDGNLSLAPQGFWAFARNILALAGRLGEKVPQNLIKGGRYGSI